MRSAGVVGEPALRIVGWTKRFGEFTALDNVSLEVGEGEVVALLGQNGSGKSTLVKILAGYHNPEPGGQLQVSGRSVPLPVPQGSAQGLGLSFVFQDLGLALRLRVVENLFVGRRRVTFGRGVFPIRWREEFRRARAICSGYGLDVDPRALVSELSPTERALLAIVRAAEVVRPFSEHSGAAGHGVLVLDEPTVFLPQHEKVFLFDLIRKIAKGGTAVIFVSHDMSAVREIANRAVILKDGKVSGEVVVGDVTDEELIERVSGQRGSSKETVAKPIGGGQHSAGGVLTRDGKGEGRKSGTALIVENLRGGHLNGIDLVIHEGEILGVAGLLGSGSDEIPYAVFGALSGVRGRVQVGSWIGDAERLTPRRARQAGLALVPADRKEQGIAVSLPVHKNMMSLVLGDYFRYGTLRHGRMRSSALERIQILGIRPSAPELEAVALSGGNQQKVLLAKWIEELPRCLLLHEPTQGVDVGTRREIYELMRSLRSKGLGILWVSTDFDELASICDRVVVCADGRIVGEVPGPPYSRDAITNCVYAADTRQRLGA